MFVEGSVWVIGRLLVSIFNDLYKVLGLGIFFVKLRVCGGNGFVLVDCC